MADTEAAGRKTSTLYITGLDVSVSDRDLRDECAKFGAIKRVTIIKDKETRTSKGFGYLLFKNADEASKALKELDGRVIADKPVKCKYSHSETPEWQMILDGRKQVNGGSMPGPPRGRGARRPGRGQFRGQGRGMYPSRETDFDGPPPRRGGSRGRPGRGGMSSERGSGRGRGAYRGASNYGSSGRGDYGDSSYDDYGPEGDDYDAPGHGDYGYSARDDYDSIGRGDYPPYGRGGAASRGASRGLGGARGSRGYDSYPEDRRQPADDYQDPYDETYGETVSRRPRTAASRDYDIYERPSAYGSKEPPRAAARQYESYDRYSEGPSKAYDDRSAAIYEDRLPITSKPSLGAGKAPIRGEFDRYSTSQLVGLLDSLPKPAGARVPPREAPARDPYYDRAPERSIETERYDTRYPERATAPAPRTERGYETGYETGYDNSRKRPAQGYAGYSDNYDQPPPRVSRSQEVSYRY